MDVREQPEGGQSGSAYWNFLTLCRRLLSCIPLDLLYNITNLYIHTNLNTSLRLKAQNKEKWNAWLTNWSQVGVMLLQQCQSGDSPIEPHTARHWHSNVTVDGVGGGNRPPLILFDEACEWESGGCAECAELGAMWQIVNNWQWTILGRDILSSIS